MSSPSDETTIHTKRYFRVVLEGIDTNLESFESFTVKLAARGHVTLSRARAVASHFPYTVKSNLTAAQANRLKTVLEEIGGRVRVEPHFVTPASADNAGRDVTRGRLREGEAFVCPTCGCKVEKGATYCSLCYRKFRDPASRLETLEERIPEKNPLDFEVGEGEIGWVRILDEARRHLLAVLIGVIVILVLVIIVK
jgi:hypothetical protein